MVIVELVTISVIPVEQVTAVSVLTIVGGVKTVVVPVRHRISPLPLPWLLS
jgi:hypothetical protein